MVVGNLLKPVVVSSGVEATTLNEYKKYIEKDPALECRFQQMNRLKDKLKQKNIDLHYSKEVVELLGMLGFGQTFGARAVKRVIEQLVENDIGMGVFRRDFKEEDWVIVDFNDSP